MRAETVGDYFKKWEIWARASEIQESNQLPDFFSYELINGKLYYGGKLVESCLSTNSDLDKQEMIGFKRIQEMANVLSSGSIIWVSPPHIERSSNTKVIVYKIKALNGLTLLEIRALILDENINPLGLARDLGEYFDNAEALRSNPFYVRNFKWDDLARYDGRQVNLIKTGKDKILQKEAEKLAQESNYYDYYGDTPISCPPSKSSPFEYFWGEAKILCCKCPFCHKQVEAKIYGGKIHCPECKSEADWKN